MTRFSERDPMRMAVVGLACVFLAMLSVFRIDELPFVGGHGETYRAEFLDAGGLRAGDPVEIAGVAVGEVQGIDIRGDRIVVTFDAGGGVRLGSATTLEIKVGDLLGQKYLDVVPRGRGSLPRLATIPLERTAEAYDVVTAFSDLTESTERLDTDGIAEALDTMSAVFQESPEEVRGALRGIAGFSRTIAKRDQVIRELMSHAGGTSRVLAERSGDIRILIRDTNKLTAALDGRRAAIHGVLVHTRDLARELRGLALDNQATLRPALRQLDSVLDLLVQQQDDLALTVQRMAMYARVFNNTVGSGPWFDSWLPNVPDTVKKAEVK